MATMIEDPVITSSSSWFTEDTSVEESGPSLQDRIDAEFGAIIAPMMSSGWVCTLTIECGTFICACR